ncbi:hypothetical protein SUGI_0511590 [Cryptomeria japonica]|nr:hypothetical protein SUGI_0511590 [Cryptomeria japonica]
MADGLVVACHSVDTWRSKLQEAKTSGKLVCTLANQTTARFYYGIFMKGFQLADLAEKSLKLSQNSTPKTVQRSVIVVRNEYFERVVVDFTATWCGPCRIISPVFVELSKKYTNVVFLKVDVDELQDVTAEWEVQAMPTFIFIKDGKAIDKIVGAKKDELERKVVTLSQA